MKNAKHNPKDSMRRRWRRWSKRSTEEVGRPLSVSDTFSGLMDIRRLVGTPPQELYDTGSGVITLSGRLPPAPAAVPPLQLYQQRQASSDWKVGVVAVTLAAAVVISLAIAVLVRDGRQPVPAPDPVAAPAAGIVALSQEPTRDPGLMTSETRSVEPVTASVTEPRPEAPIAVAKTPPVEESAARPHAASGADERARDIDRLLAGKRSRRGHKRHKADGAEAVSAAPAGPRPGTLNRAQVKAGMSAVAARVKRCGAGKSGIVVMDVVIGPNGRVVRAHATGALAGTKAGTCAAAAVRQARFPQFDGPRVGVKYPFRL